MLTPRQYSYLRAQVGATLVGVAALATVGGLTLELAFVVAFLGGLVLLAVSAPAHVTPRWRRQMRWPLLVAAGLFALLVGLRTGARYLAA